jgi:hypothetical protein
LGPFALEHGKHAEKFGRFKKLSYTIAGNGKLFEIFEGFGLGQDPSTKELGFLMITLNHMLLLQGTLNKTRRVADGFLNFENDNFSVPPLTKILRKPNMAASK